MKNQQPERLSRGIPLIIRFIALTGLLVSAVSPGTLLAQDAPGVRPRVMLGVRFADNSATLSFVKPNGPAFQAGLEVGDEIFSVEEDFVLQSNDLVRALEEKSPGDVVQVEVRRGTEYRFFDLTVMMATRDGQRVSKDGEILPPPIDYGLIGETVPELYISEWAGLDEGQSAVRFREMKGKVICVLLFQTTCEFSRKDALPMLSRLYKRYKDDPEVEFVAIQNSLPKYDENTLESAAQLCGEFDLPIPVGNDTSTNPGQSICKTLDAPGTPWFILIDREGVVRFSDQPERMADSEIIEKLKRGELVDPTEGEVESAEDTADSDDETIG